MKVSKIAGLLTIMMIALTSFVSQASQKADNIESTILSKMSEIKGGPILIAENTQQYLKDILLSSNDLFIGMRDGQIENVFHELLSENHFALAYSDNIYTVVSSNNLREKTNVTLEEGQKGKMFGSAVIHSEFIPVSDLIDIFRPLLAKYGHLSSDESTNSLVVMDHADNVERFRKIVKVLNNNRKVDK